MISSQSGVHTPLVVIAIIILSERRACNADGSFYTWLLQAWYSVKNNVFTRLLQLCNNLVRQPCMQPCTKDVATLFILYGMVISCLDLCSYTLKLLFANTAAIKDH